MSDISNYRKMIIKINKEVKHWLKTIQNNQTLVNKYKKADVPSEINDHIKIMVSFNKQKL